MKSKGIFKTTQEEEATIVPLSFVSMFIKQGGEEEKNFLNKMRKIENPNYTSSETDLDISFLKQIFHQNIQEVTMDKNHHLEMNSIFDHFPKTENEGIQKFYEESWKNLFSDFSFPQKVTKNPKKDQVQEEFFSIALDSMNEMKEEEIYEIARNYKKQMLEKNKKKSKLNWVPVIIGFDGKYFYPTNLTINKVNKTSVEQAKRQYLETIKDEEIKKDVSNHLNEMIKISWQDENGEILKGLQQ
jgi:multidrug efflux pump subunit AcrB